MRQRVNLYTRELRPSRQRLTAGSVLTSLVLVALLPLLAAGYVHWQIAALDQQMAAVSARNAQMSSAVTRLTEQLESRQPDTVLESALQRVNDTIARRERLLERVDGLTQAQSAGFSARLEALARQVPDQLWLTRIVLSGPQGELALEGRALKSGQVPVYLAISGLRPRPTALAPA